MNNLAVIDFGVPADSSPEALRERIMQLEEIMLASGQAIEIPRADYFAEGLYGREITIPAGTVLVGKIHKQQHISFLTKGDVSVMTDDGMKRIKAPATLISRAGTKRVMYAHEETIWTTVHATNEKTPDEAEKALVFDSYPQYFAFLEAKNLIEEKK